MERLGGTPDPGLDFSDTARPVAPSDSFVPGFKRKPLPSPDASYPDRTFGCVALQRTFGNPEYIDSAVGRPIDHRLVTDTSAIVAARTPRVVCCGEYAVPGL